MRGPFWLGAALAGAVLATSSPFAMAGNLVLESNSQFGGSGVNYIGGIGTDPLGGLLAVQRSSVTDGTPYLSKWDSAGSIQWSIAEPLVASENERCLTVDGAGSIYVSGGTDGASGGPSYGGHDGFIRKYGADANLLWQAQIGSSGYDHARQTWVDQSGHVYVIGHTFGTMGETIQVGGSGSHCDVFLAKYGSDGNMLWTKQYDFGRDYNDPTSIVGDESGSIYIGVSVYDSGVTDGKVLRVDLAGTPTQTWSVLTGSEGEAVRVAAPDEAGGVFFGAATRSSLGGSSLGGRDLVLGRCASSGDMLALGHYGSSGDDGLSDVIYDPLRGFLACGTTDGNWLAQNAGFYDAYVAAFDANGFFAAGAQLGSSAYDGFTSVTWGPDQKIIVVGETTGSLWATNAGGSDAILGTFAIPEPATLSLLAVGGLILIRRRRGPSSRTHLRRNWCDSAK